MQINKIEQLIERAKALYSLGKPLTKNEITEVENSLGLVFSYDFKNINLQYSYEFLEFFDTFNFPLQVIEETYYYRENYNLPKNYLVLSKQDDVSFLLLKTISLIKSEVIWCDSPDFFNLSEGKPMEYNPTIFPSFTDFFEFLVNEEEKTQAEDAEDSDKGNK